MTGGRTLDFDEWYERSAPRIAASLAAIVGDRDLARECTADACVKALVSWSRVAAMDAPDAWVLRVALNLARRRARRARRERETWSRVGAAPAAGAEPGDDELWRLVAALPERTRTAVVLRYVAGCTEPEIATAMGVSRGTVATSLHRARKQLGEQLNRSLEAHRD